MDIDFLCYGTDEYESQVDLSKHVVTQSLAPTGFPLPLSDPLQTFRRRSQGVA